MSDAQLEQQRFPVGRARARAGLTRGERDALIHEIELLPAQLRAAVTDLTDPQLDTRYRTGSWTVRQLVHHLADSHMHAYLRFKLATTAELPAIVAYDEEAWAMLPDAQDNDTAPSLALIEGLHHRWVLFLRSLDDAAFQRTYHHPDQGAVTLEAALQIYSWHGRHHLAHIMAALGFSTAHMIGG
jgi:hypothetical protein